MDEVIEQIRKDESHWRALELAERRQPNSVMGDVYQSLANDCATALRIIDRKLMQLAVVAMVRTNQRIAEEVK
jgi:hypothetical protein